MVNLVPRGQSSRTGTSVSYLKVPIIHLPGGGQCPLVRDSEPIRLLEIPTSPSLYMLISIIVVQDHFITILPYILQCLRLQIVKKNRHW